MRKKDLHLAQMRDFVKFCKQQAKYLFERAYKAEAERDALKAALGNHAIADIHAERRRQVEAKGWTPEHDDEHDDCTLAAAAACYAVCTSENYHKLTCSGALLWPGRWIFKDSGYRQNLVKSAALLVAEIERVDRAAVARPVKRDGHE